MIEKLILKTYLTLIEISTAKIVLFLLQNKIQID